MNDPDGGNPGSGPLRSEAIVSVHRIDDTLMIALRGELVADACPSLLDLLDLLDVWLTGATRRVVVDVAQVDFVDVAGLRMLLRAHRKSADHSVTLTVRHPRPHIVWLLEITDTAALLLDDTATHRLPHQPATSPTTGESPQAPHRRAPQAVTDGDERPQGYQDVGVREFLADERERAIEDRELLADERDRLVAERQQEVQNHQDWEDVREDLADERELSLEQRERDQSTN